MATDLSLTSSSTSSDYLSSASSSASFYLQQLVLCESGTGSNISSNGYDAVPGTATGAICGEGNHAPHSAFVMTSSPTSAYPFQTTTDRQLDLVTHGDIWTPDVVQRIATLIPLMAASFIGNAITIVVLTCSKYRKLNSRINIFIINLAVGDLTVCCFTMTTEVLFVIFEKAWVLGAAMCKILLYVQMVTLASTTFILTAMSIDRFLAICRPLSLGSTSGLTSRPKAMIYLAWLGAFIFASPQLFIFKQVAVGIYPEGDIKYKCLSRGYTAWWQRKTYFTFLTTYILVVPAFVICFCYFNVVKVVWRQGKEISQRDGVRLRKTVKNARFLIQAKINTIKVTLSIICAFIGCWTPYFVVHLIHIWTEYQYVIPDAVYVFAETLALLNSALNPVLYGFFNVQLKRGLVEVCCPKRIRAQHSTTGAGGGGASGPGSGTTPAGPSGQPRSSIAAFADGNSAILQRELSSRRRQQLHQQLHRNQTRRSQTSTTGLVTTDGGCCSGSITNSGSIAASDELVSCSANGATIVDVPPTRTMPPVPLGDRIKTEQNQRGFKLRVQFNVLGAGSEVATGNGSPSGALQSETVDNSNGMKRGRSGSDGADSTGAATGPADWVMLRRLTSRDSGVSADDSISDLIESATATSASNRRQRSALMLYH